MKNLKPEKVFITQEVYEKPECVERVNRMIDAMEYSSVEKVTDAELNEIAPQRWSGIKAWGLIKDPKDPDIVFTTAKFHTGEHKKERRKKYPNLGIRDLYGYHTHWFRPDGEPRWRREKKGIVCQSAWQLHSINGCPFRCSYCGLGGVIRVLVNMEEYCQHLDDWLDIAPKQRLYKWDNQTDVNCFEPEYGASKMLVEHFAEKEGKYLEIYAGKSDNVDYLLDLEHKGKTIIQWSVSGRTQSNVFEKETAS